MSKEGEGMVSEITIDHIIEHLKAGSYELAETLLKTLIEEKKK